MIPGHRPSSAVAAASALLLAAGGAQAHFDLLVPARPAADPGETVPVRYLHGHPYEHEFEPVRPPGRVLVWGPEGPARELARHAPSPGPGARPARDAVAREHLYPLELESRTDHIVTATVTRRAGAPDGPTVRSFVKVVVHGRSERGWDRVVGQPLEIVPLTRPYGLRPGQVFQARVLLDGEALEGASVEIERHPDEPPEGAPPEPEFITQSARTGPGGVLAFTPDAPGWWVAVAHGERAARSESAGPPVELRAVFLLRVGGPLRGRGARKP